MHCAFTVGQMCLLICEQEDGKSVLNQHLFHLSKQSVERAQFNTFCWPMYISFQRMDLCFQKFKGYRLKYDFLNPFFFFLPPVCFPSHLESLVMTRIKAPFSSFSLWFSILSSALIWGKREYKNIRVDRVSKKSYNSSQVEHFCLQWLV